jgi:hypothetical protein
MNWQTVRVFLIQQQYYLLLALGMLICAVFMWVGARLARVHRGNLFKALLAAILSVVVSWAFRTALTALLPVAGPIFGFLLGFLFTLLIVKAVFNTSLVRALVVWIFFLLAQPVIVFFLGQSFFGDMTAFFWKGLPF